MKKKKTYIIPCLEVIGQDCADQLLAGSPQTLDIFEESVNAEEVLAPRYGFFDEE